MPFDVIHLTKNSIKKMKFQTQDNHFISINKRKFTIDVMSVVVFRQTIVIFQQWNIQKLYNQNK